MHGREDFSFTTVNSLVGTSPVIVRGAVLDAKPGRTVGGVEDGGTDQARNVTLRVDAVLKNSGYPISSTLVLEEWGWDGSGNAYQMDSLTWSEVGDTGYYFLNKDAMLTTWRYVSTQGRVLNKSGVVRTSADAESTLYPLIEGRTNTDFYAELKKLLDPANAGQLTVFPQPVPADGAQQDEATGDNATEPIPGDSTDDGSEPTPYPSST
ncbi:hypothetical protein IQ63_05590 [Streptomyces acidiscabies]|uniref:Uncharacterized protein n=2 Tax=Streptomyces acidiscabies TaxID=42234 RepID=A0A0L0KN68_9ACTN|nr:hypothetical protein IQ63_05590 [Streptomyces acidiscabies]